MNAAPPSGALFLAADTSTRHCTVALCREDNESGCLIVGETCSDRHKLHAERLLDAVRWVLDASGQALTDVTALAISIGPGSFTGLRVGAATWKGLAFARGLPLVAVPTLDAMSRLNATVEGFVIPMLDARMGEVFGAVYRFQGAKREKRTEDRVCQVEALLDEVSEREAPLLVVGDGALRYRERILARAPWAHIVSGPCGVPRAGLVALEAMAMVHAGVNTDPGNAAPVYLRASQAEQAQAQREAQADGDAVHSRQSELR